MAILEPTKNVSTLEIMKKIHPQQERLTLKELMKKIVKEAEKDK